MDYDFLCTLTDKINVLTDAVNRMQANTGLYDDDSEQETVTGRIKKLEESVTSSDPTETNISRLKVESGLVVDEGKITLEYYPIGSVVNNEVMLQHPDDDEIWEVVGGCTVDEDVVNLHTTEYEGWKATASYVYAIKIQIEEYSYEDADEELCRDLTEFGSEVYKIIVTAVPKEDTEAVLKWENPDDDEDYYEETIDEKYVKSLDDTEFNILFKVSDTLDVTLEIRSRLS